MQYMLLIYANEQLQVGRTEEEQRTEFAKWMDYNKQMTDAGISWKGDALQPIATATSVRVRNNENMITDGPFAETKEQLGGYYLIDVENLDEALKWAARCPGSAYGTIEVRPVMVFDN